MRVIDARSGKDVRVNEWILYPAGGSGVVCVNGQPCDPDSYRMRALRPGLISAEGDFEFADGRRITAPLRVRFTHPAFMGQRVAFVSS